jgi:hypothetical protein
LYEANEYERKLIETANLTQDQYSWENGLLTIDDNVLQQAQETMQRQVLLLKLQCSLLRIKHQIYKIEV